MENGNRVEIIRDRRKFLLSYNGEIVSLPVSAPIIIAHLNYSGKNNIALKSVKDYGRSMHDVPFKMSFLDRFGSNLSKIWHGHYFTVENLFGDNPYAIARIGNGVSQGGIHTQLHNNREWDRFIESLKTEIPAKNVYKRYKSNYGYVSIGFSHYEVRDRK